MAEKWTREAFEKKYRGCPVEAPGDGYNYGWTIWVSFLPQVAWPAGLQPVVVSQSYWPRPHTGGNPESRDIAYARCLPHIDRVIAPYFGKKPGLEPALSPPKGGGKL